MGLAEADAAVDVEGVVGFPGMLRNGYGTSVREPIGAAHYEGVEGVVRCQYRTRAGHRRTGRYVECSGGGRGGRGLRAHDEFEFHAPSGDGGQSLGNDRVELCAESLTREVAGDADLQHAAVHTNGVRISQVGIERGAWHDTPQAVETASPGGGWGGCRSLAATV